MSLNENIQADGKLLQVKAREDHRHLELIDAWTTVIPARISASFLSHLKSEIPEDVHPLSHIRRLIKEEELNKNSEGVIYLRLILCTVDTIDDYNKIYNIVKEAINDDSYSFPIEKRKISKYPAYTKEQATEWSTKSWPIMWRGNPNLIKTPLSEVESEQALKYLKSVAKLSQDCEDNEYPISTIIVDPIKDQILVSKRDIRKTMGNPIHHSVMDAIYEAAKLEAERRNQKVLKNNSTGSLETLTSSSNNSSTSTLGTDLDASDKNYLCLNLHVYTTHEPCAMCSMALVHSRIGKLFYIQPSPLTGAIEPNSGAGHGIHWSKHLNWTYEAWKWLKSEPEGDIDQVQSLDKYVNA